METVFFILGLIQVTVGLACDPLPFRNDTLVPFHNNLGRECGGKIKIEDTQNVTLLEDFISKFTSLSYTFENNSHCKLHSDIILEEARRLHVPALKVIDASAKIPSGILSGNLNQYGDFDECVSSRIKLTDDYIKGKYCLITLSVKFKNPEKSNEISLIDNLIHSYRAFTNKLSDVGLKFPAGIFFSQISGGCLTTTKGHRIPKLETFNWGICVPHTCTNNELESALQTHFSRVRNPEEMQMDVFINENMCFEEGHRKFTVINIIAVLFFLLMILLAICATLTDKYGIKKNKVTRYVRCFSLKKNITILLRTDNSHEEITTLHGARFLNAIALLLSHKQMALMFHPFVNRTQMSETLGRPWSMIGRSAILYTDTFILISGLLLSNALIRELDEKRRINFKERLISRLFRFTPNLFSLVVFCTFIIEHLGSGPQWGLVVKQYADLCKQHMWKNFLYIHNYFGFENMCLTHTHQLGMDMQLFLVSPVITYVLWKNPKRGFLLLVVLGIASTYLRYYVSLKEGLSTLIYFGISVERLWKTASFSYILPTHRITVYVVGIGLGYFLRRGGKHLTLSYGLSWFGWTVAVSSGLFAMFLPFQASYKEYTYDAKTSALYNAFSPILWVIFLSWSIIACENGWGGWFNKFLSWKYFKIFTKISYAVYLTQFPVFFYGVGTQRSARSYDGIHSLIDLTEYSLILVLSIGMTLLFDLPFQNVRKVLLENSDDQRKESVHEEELSTMATSKNFKSRRKLEKFGD